jgi:hypothetical protein
LSAYVDHDFKKGFVLDEARVRKLHELISTRFAKLNEPPSLTLKVYRGDSYVYETSSVDDVLKEDNDDWRAITRLEFIAETEDVIFFILRFSSSGTSLHIVGDDRDAVFLIFSDIREYLQTSVLSGTPVSRDTIRLVTIAIMFVAMVGFLWSLISSVKPDTSGAAEVLSSNNITEKVNYLIKQQTSRHFPTISLGWLALMMLSTIGSISGIFESVWHTLFPSNLFLFGQRKEAHDKRRSLLSKVFWGVFVALGVSILAGAVLSWKGVA